MDEFYNLHEDLIIKSYDPSRLPRFQLELDYFVRKAKEKQKSLSETKKKKVLKFKLRNDIQEKKPAGKSKAKISNFMAWQAILEDEKFKEKSKEAEKPYFDGYISNQKITLDEECLTSLQITELVYEQIMREMEHIEKRVKKLINYIDDPSVSADTPIP